MKAHRTTSRHARRVHRWLVPIAAAPLLITDEYYARRGPYSFGFRMYDVFPDGERFLMFKETRATNHLIHVVLNAFRDLN